MLNAPCVGRFSKHKMMCDDPSPSGYVCSPESNSHEVETGGLLIDSFTVSVPKESVHVSETTLTFYAIYIA